MANSGTRHARISQVGLNGTYGGYKAMVRGFYLLAGGSILLPLDGFGQNIARVVVESDFGRLEALPFTPAARTSVAPAQ